MTTLEAPVIARSPGVRHLRDANVARTLATLAALLATLPVDLLVVGIAFALRRPKTLRQNINDRRTILITGGKMTKALALARAFHADGHRVVLAESSRYRLTGHRFSRAVDAFHGIPEPTAAGYALALRDVVERERVDLFVPVSSPVSSVFDARSRHVLDAMCETLHGDEATVRMLDDKARFSEAAARLGLSVPDWRRIVDPRQVEEFDFPPGRSYILKRIAYHPVGRLDLTRLSGETRERNARFVRSLAISSDDPWILQEYVSGQEYCTHGTARDGVLQVYGCCESSASQLNYAMVDKPEIQSWVQRFVSELNITGQVSFDFIENAAGRVYAIECNPRTHSAITMFHDHPQVAEAYLRDGHSLITPLSGSRPTYWLYHELWRLLTRTDARRQVLVTIARGQDAIFSWRDPLPYLLVHHLQIPVLLVGNLLRRRGWVKIDFNIGKLVEPGGD